MTQKFRSVRASVTRMRAAVASLESRVKAYSSEPPPAPLVSSSAPETALAAWRLEHERHFGYRAK